MKTVCLVILMLCFSLVCEAQSNWEKLSDTLAMNSRAKADKVLSHFDTIQVPKILYSIEDKYYYLIIEEAPCYKEYYVAIDSLGGIDKLRLVKAETESRKQWEQYSELLSQAEPIFDLSRYNTDFITKMPDAKMVSGKPSYFVIKDIDGQRYGEFSLSSITLPTLSASP